MFYRQSREAAAVSPCSIFPRRRVQLAQADHGRRRRDRLARPCGCVAIARRPTTATSTATVSAAKDSGTTKKPKNVEARLQDRRSTCRARRVDNIDLKLPDGLKFSGKGFKQCSSTDVSRPGSVPAARPARRPVPKGVANALVGPRARRTSAADISTSIRSSRTTTRSLFYVATSGPVGVQIAGHGRDHGKGRKMTISIPQELRQPVPGLDASLTGIEPDVHRQGARRTTSSRARAARRSSWKIGGKITFTQRADGAPPPAPLKSREATVKCSK